MEIANTTPAAAPAAEGVATPAPAETTPAAGAEQTTQLTQMIDKMLAGIEGKEAEAGKEAAPATYTQAQLEALVAEKLEALVAEKLEAAKTEGAESSQKAGKGAKEESADDKIAALEARLLQKELREAAVKDLTDNGFPVGLADNLLYGSEADMKKSLTSMKENYAKSLSDAMQKMRKGTTPPGLGGAQSPVGASASPAAKAEALNKHRIVK